MSMFDSMRGTAYRVWCPDRGADKEDGLFIRSYSPEGAATASWPLPKNHWLYAPRGAWDNERDDFAETPRPVLTNAQREAVIAASRYAIRGATMCGQEQDFDPDALVQNIVYALCGPATGSVLPADAAPSVAMNDRGRASDAPIDDAMKRALMKSVKFIDAAPSVAPEPQEPDDLPSQLDTIIESCSEAAWAMRTAPEPLDPTIFYDPFKELVRMAYAKGYDDAAHPPRAPLTPEQIEEMRFEANRGFCIERDEYTRAVRDTERAHGIRGQG